MREGAAARESNERGKGLQQVTGYRAAESLLERVTPDPARARLSGVRDAWL
jgi:hypothetical protein